MKDYNGALIDINKSIEGYEKSENIDWELIEAYYLRANIYKELNKDKLAIKDYSKTIELDPTNPYLYYSRGQYYISIKKNKKACQDFKKAQKLGSEDAHKIIKSICK